MRYSKPACLRKDVLLTGYFLEDAIEMTKFRPPPKEKKKKDSDVPLDLEEVWYRFFIL